ncbi:MAG: CopG family transcriptional regulator [Burkholderiaceae bacterium]
MRTTLNIDEDVLASARFLAKKSHKSVGQIVSELTRLGLEGSDRNRSVYRRFDGDARPRSARSLKSWG